ncbi:hypothetical protein [Pseudomonas phage PIP]|nr:hypothetical protein [Pseudomonas phage PIP]
MGLPSSIIFRTCRLLPSAPSVVVRGEHGIADAPSRSDWILLPGRLPLPSAWPIASVRPAPAVRWCCRRKSLAYVLHGLVSLDLGSRPAPYQDARCGYRTPRCQ